MERLPGVTELARMLDSDANEINYYAKTCVKPTIRQGKGKGGRKGWSSKGVAELCITHCLHKDFSMPLPKIAEILDEIRDFGKYSSCFDSDGNLATETADYLVDGGRIYLHYRVDEHRSTSAFTSKYGEKSKLIKLEGAREIVMDISKYLLLAHIEKT